ncbi:hypothetical protein [Motilibacter aurantiacus]|uniref:hypothetical protein n=1 Tax=Motilibacter aurantiacus TaxID=2714955 RepID=UPI001409A953|nr:hypothetical protein [Motilibacter aurantiacus]NHC45312.1 hypothetical protein [Motilibacter aurantiacus]
MRTSSTDIRAFAFNGSGSKVLFRAPEGTTWNASVDASGASFAAVVTDVRGGRTVVTGGATPSRSFPVPAGRCVDAPVFSPDSTALMWSEARTASRFLDAKSTFCSATITTHVVDLASGRITSVGGDEGACIGKASGLSFYGTGDKGGEWVGAHSFRYMTGHVVEVGNQAIAGPVCVVDTPAPWEGGGTLVVPSSGESQDATAEALSEADNSPPSQLVIQSSDDRGGVSSGAPPAGTFAVAVVGRDSWSQRIYRVDLTDGHRDLIARGGVLADRLDEARRFPLRPTFIPDNELHRSWAISADGQTLLTGTVCWSESSEACPAGRSYPSLWRTDLGTGETRLLRSGLTLVGMEQGMPVLRDSSDATVRTDWEGRDSVPLPKWWSQQLGSWSAAAGSSVHRGAPGILYVSPAGEEFTQPAGEYGYSNDLAYLLS